MLVYWTVMIGFICGAFAKYFTPKLKHGDVFICMSIGLTGSVLFYWLGTKLHLYEVDSYYGLIACFIGASSLLFFYHEYIESINTPKTPDRTNI